MKTTPYELKDQAMNRRHEGQRNDPITTAGDLVKWIGIAVLAVLIPLVFALGMGELIDGVMIFTGRA